MESKVEYALKLAPSPELDFFIFQYVFDGMIDVDDATKMPSQPIPSFSRRMHSIGAVIIRMTLPTMRKFSWSVSPDYFETAKKLGFVIRDNPVPVWRVENDDMVSYGRSFPEAVCKLAIIMRSRGII
jgi:hypothetical protein